MKNQKEQAAPSAANIYAAKLIAAFKNGHAYSFELLSNKYRKWMNTKNYFFYGNDELAEEATQDQLVALSKNILSGAYIEKLLFEGYLLILVRYNQIKVSTDVKEVEYRENASYNKDVYDEDGNGGAEFKLDWNEGDDMDYEKMEEGFDLFKNKDLKGKKMEQIYAAIDSLSEDDQKIIEMRNTHDLSFKIIGKEFGISENTASGRFFKIMKKIIKIIAKEK